jgi:hypothetical protein
MKRPVSGHYPPDDTEYIFDLNEYIEQLEEDNDTFANAAATAEADAVAAENKLADWKEHVFDDPDVFCEDGRGNLFEITEDDIVMLLSEPDNPADDEDFECPDVDDEEDESPDCEEVVFHEPVDEARDTRVAVMNFILDKMNANLNRINADFATLRELVDDEST